MDVAGKVALVTGGAGGIGKAMIEILLQKQAKVIFLVNTNENAAKKVQEELHEKYGDGKIRLYQCDVSSFEQMEACFKEVKSTCGQLHIVCNIAGVLNEINWQRMLEINLNGVVIGTKLAVQYMDGQASGGGVIVNMASLAGLSLMPFGTMYATSKYAIIGFTRAVATHDPEVIKKNLRVNVICPGVVNTPMIPNKLVPEPRYQKGMDDLFEKLPPMQTRDLVKHFVKLIEEPRHGQAMLVREADKFEILEDETKTFREKQGMEDLFTGLVKAAATE